MQQSQRQGLLPGAVSVFFTKMLKREQVLTDIDYRDIRTTNERDEAL